MATVAVFIALGGGAYAAATLPHDSVGPAQLRTHAVGKSKLARRAVTTMKIGRGAVTMRRLSDAVQAQLARAGTQGPKGDPGPGARRIVFNAAAEASPAAPTPVLNMPGLKLQATCTLIGSDVAVDLQANADEDTVLQANFTLDDGADPAGPPQPADTANIQIELPGSADAYTSLQGPRTASGYARVNARAIVVGQTRTITLNLFELVNADTGRCTVGGTAMPSS